MKKAKEDKAAKPKRKRRAKPTQLSSYVGSKKKKTAKPDRRQLRSIYKLMMTALPEARVNGLISAVHWYDAALDWAKDDEKKNAKLQSLMKLRTLESLEEIREMSFKTSDIQKKEELLKKLIQKFEEALTGIMRTKTIMSAYAKLNKAQARLFKRSIRLEQKYNKVIGVISNALRPKNVEDKPVQFKVGETNRDGPRQVAFDMRSLMYSKDYAQLLLEKYKQEGLLPVVVEELEWLARVCAHRQDETGQWKINLQQQFVAIFAMLKNLVEFLRQNPKIIRKLVKVHRRRKKRGTKKK